MGWGLGGYSRLGLSRLYSLATVVTTIFDLDKRATPFHVSKAMSALALDCFLNLISVPFPPQRCVPANRDLSFSWDLGSSVVLQGYTHPVTSPWIVPPLSLFLQFSSIELPHRGHLWSPCPNWAKPSQHCFLSQPMYLLLFQSTTTVCNYLLPCLFTSVSSTRLKAQGR